MGFPVLAPLKDWKPPAEENSKVYAKLVLQALESEAACAAYREALKNVMRSGPRERVKIARKALFGGTRQRGKQMLKVVKAAVIAGHYIDHGTDEDFTKAIAVLQVALENFDLRGASVKKWLKEKLR